MSPKYGMYASKEWHVCLQKDSELAYKPSKQAYKPSKQVEMYCFIYFQIESVLC